MKRESKLNLNSLNIPEVLADLIEKNREHNYKKIKEDMFRELKSEHKKREGFEKRLYWRWQEGLDLLETIHLLGFKLGSEFNNNIRPYAAKENDFVFEVLTMIHARSCLIFSAVISLIKSGHPSDAIARARTMHELRVIATFVKKGGNELAEKYLLYESIDTLREAEQYQQHYKRLHLRPIAKKKIEHLKKVVQKYQERFGAQSTQGDYGWASAEFNGKRVTFRDIEEKLNLSHWRPYFKLSSISVHAGAKGSHFDIGYSQSKNLLFAGSSNSGFVDPANIASMSFQVISSLLLLHMEYSDNTKLLETYLKSIVGSMLLYDLVTESNKAFSKAALQQQKEESKKSKTN